MGRDGWHDDFPYFGSNVYAYLLYRYGDFVDLVAIQFYESFSRAGKAVYHDGLSPSDYLIQFVQSLHNSNETMYVDFSGDPELGWVGPQNVSLPLSKLVLGLGNGWTIDVADHKALYVPSDQLRVAWLTLFVVNMLPRGFMFWTIMLEGVNGVYLARDLQRIVQMTEPASEN